MMPGCHGGNGSAVHKNLPARIPAAETRKVNAMFELHRDPPRIFHRRKRPVPVLPQSDECFTGTFQQNLFRCGYGECKKKEKIQQFHKNLSGCSALSLICSN